MAEEFITVFSEPTRGAGDCANNHGWTWVAMQIWLFMIKVSVMVSQINALSAYLAQLKIFDLALACKP